MPIQTKSEDKFFNKLMDETFKGLGDDFKNSSVPLRGIEKNNLILKKSIEEIHHELVAECVPCFPLEFLKETLCFRVVMDEKILDFPHNWSIFQDLFESMSQNKDYMCWIDREDDNDFILKVLGEWVGKDLEAVILLSGPNPLLAIVPKTPRFDFSVMKKNFF